MNIWVGDGRLTKDIELKTSQTGMEYCKFSIAVDRRTKKGEEKESDFVTITAFGKTAAFIAQYFHKGDEIKVSGPLQSEKWTDKNGNRRVDWNVVAKDVEFGRKKGERSGSGDSSSGDSSSDGLTDVSSEDLPF